MRRQRIISPRWTAGVMAMVVAPGVGKPDWVMPMRQNRSRTKAGPELRAGPGAPGRGAPAAKRMPTVMH